MISLDLFSLVDVNIFKQWLTLSKNVLVELTKLRSESYE